MLRVRDSGPGVPPQHASYLFTPFFTTKAPGQGTGLGLSLSYGLVKSHGGVLSYDPAPDGGAEFRVRLPLHDVPAELRSSAAGAARRADEPRRVLVVDADLGVHRLVNALLAPERYAVESVRTGEQGLRLAGERAYDLIIADARMTAGPSELFVDALLAACPAAADRLVLAYTGQSELPAPVSGPAGAPARKPFNLRDLTPSRRR